MKKLIAVLFLLIIMIGISGCTINPQANGTFGEKRSVLVSDLEIINDTASHYQYEGGTWYAIGGTIQNNYGQDTSYVKMKATTYDKNGKIVAINDSVELDPKKIQGESQSKFYFDFYDPYTQIVSYKVQIIDAK
ncbi:hypothetical protein [Methanobacterium sp.]|uniref:hypothetical protein n=1 Tax=Methanobacterium sp. TaxID=2164 RepID=UPI003C732A2F